MVDIKVSYPFRCALPSKLFSPKLCQFKGRSRIYKREGANPSIIYYNSKVRGSGEHSSQESIYRVAIPSTGIGIRIVIIHLSWY